VVVSELMEVLGMFFLNGSFGNVFFKWMFWECFFFNGSFGNCFFLMEV